MDVARVVRLERWNARCFHVVPCPFRVDLPLDMSGCITAALHETMHSEFRRLPGGMILASDRQPESIGAARNGAIFIEVEPSNDPTLAWIEGDLLTRALSPTAPRLRAEVDELVRWSDELGHDVECFYVGFSAGEGPRSFRATRLLATLDGGPVVETFEVRSSRSYSLSA
jgi:hypothetical protein